MLFRNLALGSCSTLARVGSIAAPYVVMLVINLVHSFAHAFSNSLITSFYSLSALFMIRLVFHSPSRPLLANSFVRVARRLTSAEGASYLVGSGTFSPGHFWNRTLRNAVFSVTGTRESVLPGKAGVHSNSENWWVKQLLLSKSAYKFNIYCTPTWKNL